MGEIEKREEKTEQCIAVQLQVVCTLNKIYTGDRPQRTLVKYHKNGIKTTIHYLFSLHQPPALI